MTMVLPLGWQVLDANGNPYSGAKAYFYTTGTTTPQGTYSNSGLSVANANPLVADSAGRFGPAYGPTTTDYKVVLKTSADATIATFDPVQMTGTPGAGAIGTAQIDTAAVTNAKLANMATQTIKGRTTAGTGVPEDLTVAQATVMLFDALSSSRGALPMRGASVWGALAPGVAGYSLNAAGAGADLVWANNSTRAHCQFNGSGTPAFAGTPFNFTSITDNTTGDWAVNYTSALGSANYSYSVDGRLTAGNSITAYHGTPAAGSMGVQASYLNSGSSTVAGVDSPIISIICVGVG